MFIFNGAFAQSMNVYSSNLFANPFRNLSSGFGLFNFSPMGNLFGSFNPIRTFNSHNLFNPASLFNSAAYTNSYNSIFSPSIMNAVNVPAPAQQFSFPALQLPSLNLNVQPASALNANMGANSLCPSPGGDTNNRLLATANSYVGRVNSSAEGNRLFSPAGYKNTGWYRQKGRWGWCCDFAVHCLKQALGGRFPKDMTTSSPGGLAKKARAHNAYMETPAANASSWIASNIKPGDIIYMKGRGDSGKHIAIFESISNGVIHAISGNYGGAVKKHTIKKLSEVFGFVSVGKINMA